MIPDLIAALYGPEGPLSAHPPPEWWTTVERDLKAPFPWFGGKSRAADLIWDRFGTPANYVEPFAGSLAVLLSRPDAPTIETVNDFDALLSNFWRALQSDPDAVAHHVDWPVNEVDLHARHKRLVKLKPRLRAKLFDDPDYFDARVAGWWAWGLCCWIGSGWCTGDQAKQRLPMLGGNTTQAGHGLHAKSLRMPAIGGGNGTDHPHAGRGVNSARMRSEGQLPRLGGSAGPNGEPITAFGAGIHQKAFRASEGQLPFVGGARGEEARVGMGIHGAGLRSRIVEVVRALANRLRYVRVTCGDFERILSDSVTWRHGTTGILLDPPYPASAGSTGGIYSDTKHEEDTFARAYGWAREHGHDKRLRIALCYYEGTTVDGEAVSEQLRAQGWEVVSWKAGGGYAGQSGAGNENAARERIAFSPHCLRARQGSLF